MTKWRLGGARSHQCSSSLGKLYPHFSPLLPQAGRAREEVKGLWWELPTHCLLVPGMFCTFWLGSVSRVPLARALSSLSPAEVGLEDLVDLSGHAPGRSSKWCVFFMFTGTPLLTELASYRVEDMGKIAKVFKSHQLEMTAVSIGRCISFLSQGDLRRELQLGFSFSVGREHRYSVFLCIPSIFFGLLEIFSLILPST